MPFQTIGSPALWSGFLALVALMLFVDLGLFHRKSHVVGLKEAAAWSVVWVLLAALASGAVYVWFGADRAVEFATGYLIEKALAVDNIFVFVLVFAYFSIPAKLQHRVLFYGILGALLFRAIFVAIGSALMQYHAVVLLFGAFLLFTGLHMLWAPDKKVDPEKNLLVRALRRLMPVTPTLHDGHFVVRKNGVWHATPLLVALVFLEMSDIVFAVDSVPAIFAISREPLVVFTSNVFAILGLRSMYFLLAGAVERFHLLKYGLALILIFVGLKMVWLNGMFDGKFPISWSLGVVGALLVGSMVGSYFWTPKAGSLDRAVPHSH